MRPTVRRAIWRCVILTVLPLAACVGDARRSEAVLVAFNAGSLARPMRAALDSFAAREGVQIEQESAGSLETARKLTELGHIPDVIALADHEIFPQLLVPDYTGWYALFARNRMVVAYTTRSRGANEITSENWWRVLSRPGIEVGRADPNLDPNGYRTLLVLQLAERHYGEPALAERLLANAPSRNVRPKESDLVGLLEAGELDYIWSYESMAQAAGLEYVRLPDAVDLGAAAESTFYRNASVRVVGKSPTDSLTMDGAPIVYALSIPARAPHPELALRFVEWLFSEEGRRVLRNERLDALEEPILIGAPPATLAAPAR